MNRVALTKDEAEWFSRNVVKMTQLLEATAKKKDAKILERSTYKTLASMVPHVMKAQAQLKLEAEPVELHLTRKQKLTVRELITSVNKTLKEHVIPEYTRRQDTKALENATVKAAALDKMARKFK
jgi:hypothetical protein